MQSEIAWINDYSFLRACVVDDNPLTVNLEIEDDSQVRFVQAFRPWRTYSWRWRIDADIIMYDDIFCDLSAYVSEYGRARQIYLATKHSWNAYKKFANGQDSLRPLSETGINDYGGISITAIDSLDTLWLLDMHDEFNEAVTIVNNTIYLDNFVNVFETSIRALGGLLSAYTLTNQPHFIAKAVELGNRLLPAFETHIPKSDVNLVTNLTRNAFDNKNSLSEMTLTLEYNYLSLLSNKSVYADKIKHVDDWIHTQANNNGNLLNIFFETLSEKFIGPISLGARGDSYYEYLLKEYIRSKNVLYGDDFKKSFMAIQKYIMDDNNFIHELDHGGKMKNSKMDHLVCFLPGVIALAVKEKLIPNSQIDIAHKILTTCLKMHNTETGVAPEIIKLDEHNTLFVDSNDVHNLLRPETLESLYIMSIVTKDPVYKEWSWKIFETLENRSRVTNGYACIKNVQNKNTEHIDYMPSYWISETLKYAWLTATSTNVLDKYVLNTEAHLFFRSVDAD